MKDKYEAKFVMGVVGSHNVISDDKPQYAFVGRSNVGKSSLINMLLGQKKLVKSSSTPGKTQQINFFDVENKVYFVDLPGYGYAKISQKRREKLRKLILWYFISGEANVSKVVIVLDAKIGLTEFDRDIINVLEENRYPYIIVMNKIDKLNQKKLHASFRLVQEEIPENVEIVLVSSLKLKGREILLNKIEI